MPRKRTTAPVVEDLELEDFEDEVYEDDEEEAEATPTKKGKPRKAAAESNGISASALAERLGLEPKTFRAWLRAQVEQGKLESSHEKKARYDFGETWSDPRIVAIITRYEEWKATASERRAGNAEALAKGRAKAAANRAARKAAAEATDIEEDEAELEELDEEFEEEEVEETPPVKRRRKTSG
jgi:hypothetical protein